MNSQFVADTQDQTQTQIVGEGQSFSQDMTQTQEAHQTQVYLPARTLEQIDAELRKETTQLGLHTKASVWAMGHRFPPSVAATQAALAQEHQRNIDRLNAEYEDALEAIVARASI